MILFVRTILAFSAIVLTATFSVAEEPKEAVEKVTIGYVYAAENKAAESFKKMLDAEGFTVELITSNTATKVAYSKYDLVVIGNDAVDIEEKVIAHIMKKVKNLGKPVLGLGEGGYAFFGENGLKLAIGAPHGAHDLGGNAQAVSPVGAEDSPLWKAAGISDGKAIKLFNLSGTVEIYQPKPPVVLLGQTERDANYYTIVRQGKQFVLWGYTGVPDDMTAEGRKLFIKTCQYTANLGREKAND